MNARGYALLAMCVRSPEARRRILGEVAKALRHGSEETGTGTGTAAGASSGPARAFVELVNSLVKTAASKATLAGELQRGMRDAELLPALCAALERVDLNDPDAPAIVNAILRPMEALTRPGAGTKGAGAGARGGTGDGGEAGRDAAGGSTGTGPPLPREPRAVVFRPRTRRRRRPRVAEALVSPSSTTTPRRWRAWATWWTR